MGLRLIPLLLALAGCSAGTFSGDPKATTSDAGRSALVDSAVQGPDSGLQPPPIDRPVAENVRVFAHSAGTLYAFDPSREAVTEVGAFRLGPLPPPSITDLAVDKAGGLVACDHSALFRVDPNTAELTLVGLFSGALGGGQSFNGLSFLPEGEVDGAGETLVGVTAQGSVFRVDPANAVTTLLGQYGGGFGSSGDLVSVLGAGTFATARVGDGVGGGATSDMLVRLDLRSGSATPIGQGIGFSELYGLGYFRNRLYGFGNRGELVLIDINTGVGSLVSMRTGATSFWGAGVTTLAPTAPF